MTSNPLRAYALRGIGTAASLALLLTLGCSNGSRSSPGSSTTTPPTTTNTAPQVAVVTPDRVSKGLVPLQVVLTDDQSDQVSLAVEVSTDRGATWTAAAGVSGNGALASSPGGTAHALVWDSDVDLGAVNELHVALRLTPSDAATGAPATTREFAVINLGRLDPDAAFDARPDALVFRSAIIGGFVPPTIHVNRVDAVRIYGDGKVVFTSKQDALGLQEIRQGTIREEEIVAILLLAKEKGFWGYLPSYYQPVGGGPQISDAPSWTLEVRLSGKTHTSTAYNGSYSAPTGFMDLYAETSDPVLAPRGVQTYTRQTIDPAELAQGFYSGEEFEKKLDTPRTWTWNPAGSWRSP